MFNGTMFTKNEFTWLSSLQLYGYLKEMHFNQMTTMIIRIVGGIIDDDNHGYT